MSGYRPRVTATASLTEQYLDTLTKSLTAGRHASTTGNQGDSGVSSAGVTVTQTLFNGFQTGNRTRQAEGQVFAARETLRTTEQTVLLNAATAYMNLLRDAAILELQRSNVNVLEVTLRQTRDRFNVGEVTRTDVAQAESRLAAGRSQLPTAESNYVTSQAQYLQVIGVPAPARLAPATPVDRFSPRTLLGADRRAGAPSIPTITTAMYNVDVAAHQVKIAEGALYPTLSAVGNVQKSYGSTSSLAVIEQLSASLAAQLSVPIYQGGAEYAAIRQAKETLGQRRLDLDTARDQVQSTVDPGVGPARGRQGADHRHPGAGRRLRNRAQRRARGGPRRPAHHARRAQCAAGAGQRARRAGDRAARPGGGVLYGAGGGRQAVAADARARGSRSTIRWCTTSRCATRGAACASRTGGKRRQTTEAVDDSACPLRAAYSTVPCVFDAYAIRADNSLRR